MIRCYECGNIPKDTHIQIGKIALCEECAGRLARKLFAAMLKGIE